MEHHSNILPWQMVCCQTGAQLKFMECEPDGSLDLNKVEALITARTRVVALQQVSNVLGREYPIRAVAELAHRVGAVLVVDGAQSTPHLPVNVQELGADFLAFSGHKLYRPMGIGALYGRRELLEEMPPFLTGGEMIESVTREGAVFAEAPHKFEAGTVNAAGAAACTPPSTMWSASASIPSTRASWPSPPTPSHECARCRTSASSARTRRRSTTAS